MDGNGRNALHLASRAGHENCITYLIEKGVDANVVDREGLTPLMHATNAGNEAASNLLISKGGDCTITDNIGNHCLHGATAKGLLGLVKAIQAAVEIKTLQTMQKYGQYMLLHVLGKLLYCVIILKMV